VTRCPRLILFVYNFRSDPLDSRTADRHARSPVYV
jgi:hypothetical protein